MGGACSCFSKDQNTVDAGGRNNQYSANTSRIKLLSSLLTFESRGEQPQRARVSNEGLLDSSKWEIAFVSHSRGGQV